MPLAWLSPCFQSLALLPTSKLGPSGADSQVWGGGCVWFWTLWVCLSNELSCEAGSFSCCCDPRRFLLANVLRLYFPTLEPWLVQSVLFPSCSPQFIHTQMWDCPLCQLQPCLPWSFSCCAGCPSMPLLPV